MNVRMYVCIHMYIHIYTHTHAYMRTPPDGARAGFEAVLENVKCSLNKY